MRPLLLLLVLALPAWAYDSKCYHPDGGACAEGPDAARNRWLGTLDEHRELFTLAGAFSGIPAELFRDFDLPVFLGDQTVTIEGRPERSFITPALSSVKASAQRTTSIAEFAQLPDFSYSLADWALGNETCPLDAFLSAPVAAGRCHAFEGHMGALNSNHFLPQSQEFYRAYHSLALTRAGDCRHLNQGLPPASRARFAAFFTDCQREALILEAVGQHFLQDAWSTGHMWERWGSPDPRDFTDLPSATMIAMTAGMIHGVRGLAQSMVESGQATVGLADLSLVDFDDALCAPHEEVRFVGGQFTSLTPGVGDLYSVELLIDQRFDAQRAQFYSCSVSGLRAVYEATGEVPRAPGGNGLRSVDATSDACFGQRVTNAALRKGAGIDLTTGTGDHVYIPFEAWLVGQVVGIFSPTTGGLGDPQAGNPEQREALYRQSMIRLASQLTVFATASPEGTSLANGLLHPLLGIEPNSRFAFKSPPSPYLDPPLPWAPTGGSQPAEVWKAALARTFHRAHALDWCHAFAAGSAADLDGLRTAVTAAPEGEARTVACQVCSEFVSRHVRLGTGPGDYDTSQEPLCGHFESEGPVQFAYQPATGPSSHAAAQQWCGCSRGPQLGAGHDHMCAITSGGALRCWGRNDDGQVGNGSFTDSPVPVDVTGLGSGVVAVAIGRGFHSCAVISGGAVKCWGNNFSGQLGNGSTTFSSVPVDVTGLGSGVVGVAAGMGVSCAITNVGALKCWGHNLSGELGNGSTTSSQVPVDVTGLGSGVVAVAAGSGHTCALTSDGALKCWGNNATGQLGNGSTTNSQVPVTVTGLGSGVVAVAAGEKHTCALTSGGALKCWGFSPVGEIGNGSTTFSSVPVDVTGLGSGVMAVAGAGNHTCALTTGGAVKCWGSGAFGLLGNGLGAESLVPVDVTGLGSGVLALVAGHGFTCALTSGGAVKCWGQGISGQLGNGSATNSLVPVDVTGFP